MGELSGTPYLPHQVVAKVAVAKIEAGWLRHKALRSKEFIRRHEESELGIMSYIGEQRNRAAQKAASESMGLMSDSETLGPIAKRWTQKSRVEVSSSSSSSSSSHPPFPPTFIGSCALEFEKSKRVIETTGGVVGEFIGRMERLASHMRGSFYFHESDQQRILKSGSLLAMHTRERLGMGSESHTTSLDKKRLGNHDHVFFFLEHEDAPMRPTRFATESTDTGFTSGSIGGDSSPGSRRISFPLAHLMREGTWAMKQDFLSPELRSKKEIPKNENFVASAKEDPHDAARHFMHQLALSALDMPGLKGKKGVNGPAVRELMALKDDQFIRQVFRDHLSPQLMVPSFVSLRGGRLEMPVAEFRGRLPPIAVPPTVTTTTTTTSLASAPRSPTEEKTPPLTAAASGSIAGRGVGRGGPLSHARRALAAVMLPMGHGAGSGMAGRGDGRGGPLLPQTRRTRSASMPPMGHGAGGVRRNSF
jgi:hypothetical protein